MRDDILSILDMGLYLDSLIVVAMLVLSGVDGIVFDSLLLLLGAFSFDILLIEVIALQRKREG